MTVEGYTNYATSSVAITIQNDRVMSGQLDKLVSVTKREALDADQVRDGIWTSDQARRFLLADAIKDWVERIMERGVRDGDVGLVAAALVRAGFSEVEWEELASDALARSEEAALTDPSATC